MQIDGAIIREQGIVFAIVVVQMQVLKSKAKSESMRASLADIADFNALPIALAAQDHNGRFEYQARPDIADFLASIDASCIPWKRYTVC